MGKFEVAFYERRHKQRSVPCISAIQSATSSVEYLDEVRDHSEARLLFQPHSASDAVV